MAKLEVKVEHIDKIVKEIKADIHIMNKQLLDLNKFKYMVIGGLVVLSSGVATALIKSFF